MGLTTAPHMSAQVDEVHLLVVALGGRGGRIGCIGSTQGTAQPHPTRPPGGPLELSRHPDQHKPAHRPPHAT